eukprot:2602911-Rhodomonas_salina.1
MARACPQWEIVARRRGRKATPQALQTMGTQAPKDILMPEHAKVLEKGWHKHCNNKMHPGGWLQYWRTPTAGLINFKGIEGDLHFTYSKDTQPDAVSYTHLTLPTICSV